MQQATRAHLALVVAALGWLGGCGALPTGSTAARTVCVVPPQPTPSPSPLKTRQTKRPVMVSERPVASPTARPAASAGSQPATVAAPDGATVGRALVEAILATAGYSAIVTKTERDLSDGAWKTTQTRVISKKGDRVLVEALVHYKPSNVGARLRYRVGSDTVTVRPAGVLSFLTKDFPMTDKAMLSGAGYRLDRFDFYAIAERLQAPVYAMRLVGKTSWQGQPLHVLEVTAPPGQNGFDPGIVKELFGFEPQSHRIRTWEAYRQGDDRVLQVTIDSFEALDNVPESLLTL